MPALRTPSALIAVLAGAAVACAPTRAGLYTVTSGNLAASVDFSKSGTTLTAVLTNTSTSDVMVPTDVLTAVFFNAAGSPWTPVSAVLTSGSVVRFGGSDPGGVVGGEWGYGAGLSGAPATAGISSSGLGVFGGPTFPGNNLQGPAALGGLQYGLTSFGDNPLTGNAPVTGGFALIQNSVTFKFTVDSSFNPDTMISDVSFQYGTALSETRVPVVPEAASFVVWGLLMGCGFGLCWHRRRRSAS